MTGAGRYRVGILGAGQIVANMHLPVLLAMPQVRLSWVADVNAAKAGQVAESFGIRSVSVSALESEAAHVDAVLIAVPYGAREAYYAALSGLSIALYVEKPFARTVEDHQRYCSWFAKRQIAVGFQRRAWGPLRSLKAILGTEMFGRIRSVTVEHGITGQLTGSSYSGDFALARGGMLFEVAIHWLDAALFLVEARGASLKSGHMLRKDEFDLHTQATFQLTTDRGDVDFHVLATGLRDTRNLIEVEFENAILQLAQGEGRITVHSHDQTAEVELVAKTRPFPMTPYQQCHKVWEGFFESLETGRPNWTSASESFLTTSVIEQLYGLRS